MVQDGILGYSDDMDVVQPLGVAIGVNKSGCVFDSDPEVFQILTMLELPWGFLQGFGGKSVFFEGK